MSAVALVGAIAAAVIAADLAWALPPQQAQMQTQVHVRISRRDPLGRATETYALRFSSDAALMDGVLQDRANLAFGEPVELHLDRENSKAASAKEVLQQAVLVCPSPGMHSCVKHVQLRAKSLVSVEIAAGAVPLTVWQIAQRSMPGTPMVALDMRRELQLLQTLHKSDISVEIPRHMVDKLGPQADLLRGLPLEFVGASSGSFRNTTVAIPPKSERGVQSSRSVAATRVLVGIVIDGKFKFLQQAHRWVEAFFAFGGELVRSGTVLACVLPSVPSEFRQYLARSGVIVRDIEPLAKDLPNATPHSNKLRLLEQPEARNRAAFDCVVYMDTDTLVMSDFSSYLRSDVLQFRAGRTLWGDSVRVDQTLWQRLFELSGLIRTGLDAKRLADLWPNTGVLIFPTTIVPRLLDRWTYLTDRTRAWLDTMRQDVYFTETISLLLAMLQLDASYEVLPAQMNAQLNLPRFDFIRNGYFESLSDVPPAVVHYALGTIPAAGHTYSVDTLTAFPFLRHVQNRLDTVLREVGIRIHVYSSNIDTERCGHVAMAVGELSAAADVLRGAMAALETEGLCAKGAHYYWLDWDEDLVQLRSATDVLEMLKNYRSDSASFHARAHSYRRGHHMCAGAGSSDHGVGIHLFCSTKL